jgi:uncharacterized SAM-binding protein YcdF (DUF218 family)
MVNQGRRRRWGAALVLGVPVAGLLGLALSIGLYARVYDESPSDAAIVLGAAVEDSRPTPVFRERLRHAVDLHRRGVVRRLLLTGGVGAADVLAEAEVGRDYCLSEGVPAADLFLEKDSHSTRENLQHASAIAAAQGMKRVLIVSDPLHMRRAITLARDAGLDAHPSPTPSSRYVSVGSRAPFLARETYFYARYLLLGP